MGIFKFGSILIKNLLKTSAWSSEIIFSDCSSPSLDATFFSMGEILRIVCNLSVNKGFTVFQNALLSVMSGVLMLLKKFLFSRLIQRLRCFLYVFLSMSLLVFKILFIRSMVCTYILLFYWSVSLSGLIKWCFEKIKFKVIVVRRHLKYPILDISNRPLIRKMFLAAVSDNGWHLFFWRILSLPLLSIYENLTTMFLMSQNFKSVLVC